MKWGCGRLGSNEAKALTKIPAALPLTGATQQGTICTTCGFVNLQPKSVLRARHSHFSDLQPVAGGGGVPTHILQNDHQIALIILRYMHVGLKTVSFKSFASPRVGPSS